MIGIAVSNNLTDPVDPAFVRDFQHSTLARPVAAEFVETVIAESLKMPAHAWREALRSMLNEDRTEWLGAITVPTLIIWGDRDDFAGGAEQDRLVKAIPGARLAVHAGAGHAPHWEDPVRVANDIVTLLSVERSAR